MLLCLKENYLKIDICECCRWVEVYLVDFLVKYKLNCKWLLGLEVSFCLYGKCFRFEIY